MRDPRFRTSAAWDVDHNPDATPRLRGYRCRLIRVRYPRMVEKLRSNECRNARTWCCWIFPDRESRKAITALFQMQIRYRTHS